MLEVEMIDKLAELLNNELIAKGKSYTVFADLCGINRNLIGQLTAGKKKDIKISTIARICENADFKPEQIFGDIKPERILDGSIITINGQKYKMRLEKTVGM